MCILAGNNSQNPRLVWLGRTSKIISSSKIISFTTPSPIPGCFSAPSNLPLNYYCKILHVFPLCFWWGHHSFTALSRTPPSWFLFVFFKTKEKPQESPQVFLKRQSPKWIKHYSGCILKNPEENNSKSPPEQVKSLCCLRQASYGKPIMRGWGNRGRRRHKRLDPASPRKLPHLFPNFSVFHCATLIMDFWYPVCTGAYFPPKGYSIINAISIINMQEAGVSVWIYVWSSMICQRWLMV